MYLLTNIYPSFLAAERSKIGPTPRNAAWYVRVAATMDFKLDFAPTES
jgi:hypothetical protein